MSQNILTNTSTPPLAGSTAIGVMNLAADSLARWFCGAATPTASAAGLADLKGFVWHDTAANALKVRDQADTAWIVVGYFDETGKTFTPHTNPAAVYAADTGAANAYAVAPVPAWASYATGGPLVAFVGAHANTGASTLNVCGLGTKALTRLDGSALIPGDVPGAQISVAIWNQARGAFQLLTQTQLPAAVGAAGLVALASAADVLAGSSPTEAVSPASLTSQLAIAANGYATLPGGLILQWGHYNPGGWNGATTAISFPLTFPNACLNVGGIPDSAGITGGKYGLSLMAGPTTTSASFGCNGYFSGGSNNIHGFYWFAIGY